MRDSFPTFVHSRLDHREFETCDCAVNCGVEPVVRRLQLHRSIFQIGRDARVNKFLKQHVVGEFGRSDQPPIITRDDCGHVGTLDQFEQPLHLGREENILARHVVVADRLDQFDVVVLCDLRYRSRLRFRPEVIIASLTSRRDPNQADAFDFLHLPAPYYLYVALLKECLRARFLFSCCFSAHGRPLAQLPLRVARCARLAAATGDLSQIQPKRFTDFHGTVLARLLTSCEFHLVSVSLSR